MTIKKKLITEDLVVGLDYELNNDSIICKSCCKSKSSRVPFKSSNRHASKPFELVHTDLCGKLDPSIGGVLYFLTFIDDFTHYTWVYILKAKSETFDRFKEWKLLFEKQFKYSVKTLRSDNGEEYTSAEFEHFLKQEGIVHQKRYERHLKRMENQNALTER